MKAKILCILSALSLLLLTAGCGNAETFVGSLDTEGFSLDVPVYEDLSSMVDAADLIVVGKATGVPEIIPGNKMTTTIYNFSVEENLKGSEIKEVKFCQLGADGSDAYETKIKKNKRYILFLGENYERQTMLGEKEMIYNSICYEQGIFEINGAGKLKAYTRIGAAPKMTDKNLSDIKKEIDKYTQE